MNNTHRYLSWKHQPSCYGEEPLPSLPIMYSILEISHEKQERCKHDAVDEMCMMYCKTGSSYLEEISLSHHRKKVLCIIIWVPSFDDGQHGMDLHGMWIKVEAKKKKKNPAESRSTKDKRIEWEMLVKLLETQGSINNWLKRGLLPCCCTTAIFVIAVKMYKLECSPATLASWPDYSLSSNYTTV